ncbi:MAG: DNA polymerase III subunit delta [Candidatus Dormibacteria bacterium]
MEPLILVHGDDAFLVTRAATAQLARLLEGVDPDLALEQFRAPRDLVLVAESLATPPFLSPRRVVVVWDPPQLAKGERSAKSAEQLLALLAERAETTAALLVCRSPLAPNSPALHKLKHHGGQVHQIHRPKGRDMGDHLGQELRRRGLRAGRRLQLRLLEIGSQDLGRLDQELDKLELLGKGASEDECLQLVPPLPPGELYRLSDCLFNSPERLGLALGAMTGGNELAPVVVIAFMARVLRDLITFAEGGSASIPDWRRQRLERQLQRAGASRLRHWLVQLSDLDWSTRTGAVDPGEGLEVLLAGFCRELLRGRSQA